MMILKCNICTKKFEGWGNNSKPYNQEKGLCCDKCNYEKVIPYRLELMGITTEYIQDVLQEGNTTGDAENHKE